MKVKKECEMDDSSERQSIEELDEFIKKMRERLDEIEAEHNKELDASMQEIREFEGW